MSINKAIIKRLNEIEKKLYNANDLVMRFVDFENDKYLIKQSTIESEIGNEFSSIEEIHKLPKGNKDTFLFLENLSD